MKKYDEKEIEKLKETFYEEIKKKDKIIDELTIQNEILLKTALKNANKKIEEEERKEIIKKNK
jgi:hypothetical protein